MDILKELNDRPVVRVAVLIAIGILVGLLIAELAPYQTVREGRPPGPFPGDRDPDFQEDLYDFYLLRSVVAWVSVVLITDLFILYINDYRKTKAEFMLGLSIFIGFMLLNVVMSIPQLHALGGFFSRGMGPFSYIPQIAQVAAVAILDVLSRR